MNPSGTIICSGSPENTIRVWDPRTCTRIMKLRGHSENIRAIVISSDGQQVVSGSSDGTIKVWSMGQQRCIQTIHVHSEGVWALLMTDTFSHVISGSRDKKIFMTELRNPVNSVLVCEEKAPVLSLCYNLDQSGVWATTWDSDIKCWKLPRADRVCQNHPDGPVINTKEVANIKGGTAIKKFSVLNDKRHILTKDSDNNVALYDVLKVIKVEDLGNIDFDEEVNKRNQRVYIPNWFTVDLKIGMPTIVLDEVDCFAAWVSAEGGLPDYVEAGSSDLKVRVFFYIFLMWSEL